MEGGALGYGNLQNTHPSYRLSPPLTAIDRFLCAQNHSSQQQTQNDVKNKGTLVSENGLFDFSSFSGAIGSYAGGVSCPCLSGTSFVNRHLLDGEALNWMREENPRMGLKEEVNLALKQSRGLGKIAKGGYSTALIIKGQWTDEEDRELVRLVNQYGIRKWAQIAEKMDGRAGKQCRERWNNHLRPGIKKDTWSEEEERVLVEAHEQIGNRWSEMAKRIPGRAENSIKNHWNVTKRRQNSRRSSSKGQTGRSSQSSSILQDYIKSKNLNATSTSITPTQSTTTLPPIDSTVSEELSESNIDDTSPFMTPTYDEELRFMQNFFGNNNNNNQPSNDKVLIATRESQKPNNDNVQKEETPKTQLYNDLYLSYLLNGVTPSPSMECYSDSMKMSLQTAGHASSSANKEMDLIEMVSSSQFYQGSN